MVDRMADGRTSSPTVTETGTAQALIPLPKAANLLAVVKVVLPPEKVAAVDDLARRFAVMTVEPHALITFGQEAVASFGARLDEILRHITNAESPVLFELFRTIRDGVEGADLKDLELNIRN